MGQKFYTVICAAALVCALHACQQSETPASVSLSLPATPYDYNVANDHVPTLGRVLFYDRRLSVNNSVSCANCHQQARAFADGLALSVGFEGARTTRNAMPIQNLSQIPFIFNNPSDSVVIDDPRFLADTLSLFWDGREKVLEKMVLQPIANHVEMGIRDLDELAAKVQAIPEYRKLFTNAYGSDVVTQENIADALTKFISSITTANSRFDQHARGGQPLNALETFGESLFLTKYNCNSCHQIFALNGYQLGGGDGEDPGFVNIGLDQIYDDPGHEEVTKNADDAGRFKIPTLRNVALTGPYMHDGRFNSLSEVVDHYSSGIKNHPNLDSRLKVSGKAIKMDISEDEKAAIIAFLETLTDYTMVTDPKFSNPFIVQ